MADLSGAYAGSSVLITGGAGFIGSHLADHLIERGASNIAIVDNLFLGNEQNLENARTRAQSYSFYREDAADADAMRAIVSKEKPDFVFDCATKALLYSFFNPAGACRVNLDIALVLAELLRDEMIGKLVHISSSEVYGSAVSVPMDETHPLLAETTYAAGKAAADLALQSYARMFDLDIRLVRPFNNYGPRQNSGQLAAIVPLSIKRIQTGGQPFIEGDGLQTRDFIFVNDTVSAIADLAVCEATGHDPINVASGVETSILEIVQKLCQVMGYTDEIEYRPARKADVLRHVADVSRATSLIGEIGKTPLETGLAATAEWFQGRLS